MTPPGGKIHFISNAFGGRNQLQLEWKTHSSSIVSILLTIHCPKLPLPIPLLPRKR